MDQRIALVFTGQKLFVVWRQGEVGLKVKLQTLDAIIRAKLVYGLEGCCLTASMTSHLNAFHLMGLRRILQMDTTFINRSNANAMVLQRANAAVGAREGEKRIRLLADYLRDKACALFAHNVRGVFSDPFRQTSFGGILWIGISRRLKE